MIIDSELINRVKSEIPVATLMSEITGDTIDTFVDVQVRCNLHGEDNKPSAKIYAENNIVKCWACSKTRDSIQLYRDWKNLSFKEAVKELAENYLHEVIDAPKTKEERQYEDSVLEAYIERKTHRLDEVLKRARPYLSLDAYNKCWTVRDFVEYSKSEKAYITLSQEKRLDLLTGVEQKITRELGDG